MPAYVLYDATISLYRCKPDGSSGDIVYIGECPRGITVDEQVEEIECRGTGRRAPKRSPGLVSYRIEANHVMTSYCESATGSNVGNSVDPCEDYYVVIVYYCEEKDAWIKDTFTGVKGVGRKWTSSGPEFTIDSPFTADRRFRRTGCGSGMPDTLPDIKGRVRYIESGTVTELYEYNFATGQFTNLSFLGNPAGVNENASSVPAGADWYVQIGGDVKFYLSVDDNLLAEQFHFNASFDDAAEIRVEFVFGDDILLIVDVDGLVIARDGYELDSLPGNGFSITIKDALQTGAAEGEIGFNGLVTLGEFEEVTL